MDEQQNTNENDQDSNENQSEGKFKQWLQDNLRIIISIVIVVAIAGGVYSYSKRTNETKVQQNPDQLALEMLKDSSKESIVSEKEKASTETKETTPVTETETEKEEPAKPAENNVNEQASSASTSQETEGSFIETAGKGDGLTHLARRALANYLEKNTDSNLTAEHKIYIEDYLRKNVGHKGNVRMGTSVEFSKDIINQAIERSKTLNEGQLKNLHKYVVRVPSLS